MILVGAVGPGRLLASVLLVLGISTNAFSASKPDEEGAFDDRLLSEEIAYPAWFKLSLGNLAEDLESAIADGKKGIIVYFGQSQCAYCKRFLELDLGQPDIEMFVRQHYDVIPVDIWGIGDIVDTDGAAYSERSYSVKYKANFTPALIFYDAKGEKVFRLRGFYPPYKFRAALKYVVEGFYADESFRDYLARAEPGLFFYEEGLAERDFLTPPPFNLNRTQKPADRPLAVFFERGNCHACELLHSGPLNDPRILAAISKMQVVQLNIAANTPLTTPRGKETTAKDWAAELGLFHTPTIVFFDPNGMEIFRIDSIVQFYRVLGVLEFVNQAGYLSGLDYQGWRLRQRPAVFEE